MCVIIGFAVKEPIKRVKASINRRIIHTARTYVPSLFVVKKSKLKQK